MHVNINKRQSRLRELKSNGSQYEHWLYEAKRAMQELKRLPYWFKKLRENDLPKTFTYCSLSETEELPVENQLICCLGVDVSKCEYLANIFADTAEYPPELIDQAKAHICVGHILQESARRFIDTSEGYVQDETDRQFWQRTYHYMAMTDENDAPRPERKEEGG
jgi:hypothetical protein